ncbi:MAG: ABC transporter permease [Meiothermus sp.]|nr:ABC transporter permease [Meiothermus sp.]
MLRVLVWEFGKLVRLRSVQIGLLAAFLLPFLWAFAPGLRAQYRIELVSGWQVPAFALFTGMDFLFPFLTAMAAAEGLGSEVSMGTLKSVLLRPSPRSRLLGAKLVVVLTYPFLLLGVSLLGSLLAGLPFGLGSFLGGTGLGPGSFAGTGEPLTPGAALSEVLRAHALAGVVLWPLSALALLYAVIFLSTTAAALAAVSTLLLMRLLVAFPALQPFLLTSYLDLYVRSEAVSLGLPLLFIYTLGFSALALLIFERKDV